MERKMIEMVLTKNSAMGKAGTEVTVDTEHTAEYFIKTGKAKYKTEVPEQGASELTDEPAQKTAPAKKATKK